MRIFLLLYALMGSAWAKNPAWEIAEDAQNISCALETQSPETLQSWVTDLVRVRVILEVGVDIPIFSQLSLNPEVEFYFSRK